MQYVMGYIFPFVVEISLCSLFLISLISALFVGADVVARRGGGVLSRSFLFIVRHCMFLPYIPSLYVSCLEMSI
jgi:hypothetical protein